VKADVNMLETTRTQYTVRDTRFILPEPLVKILTVMGAVYNGVEGGCPQRHQHSSVRQGATGRPLRETGASGNGGAAPAVPHPNPPKSPTGSPLTEAPSPAFGDAQPPRYLQPQMPIDNFAIAACKNGDLEAELANGRAHAIHRRILFAILHPPCPHFASPNWIIRRRERFPYRRVLRRPVRSEGELLKFGGKPLEFLLANRGDEHRAPL
jgi:hypothetical protein